MDSRFSLLWPTDYPEIVREFVADPEAWRELGLAVHAGVDIRAPEGSNVYACADGVVSQVDYYRGNPRVQPYGTHIRIQHADGYETIYAHLREIQVQQGETVSASQVVGLSGKTGDARGPHLHLGLKREDATRRGDTRYPDDLIDPTPFLRPLEGAGAPGQVPQPVAQESASGHLEFPVEESGQDPASPAEGQAQPTGEADAEGGGIVTQGFALNDRPEGVDRLGYDDYAKAFARVIANPDTKTPLTIGVYGAWGMGKSFLMGKVEAQLKAIQAERQKAHPPERGFWRRLLRLPAPSAKDDFIFVHFNAWVYSGSDNLWAGMVTVLYDAVERYFGPRPAAYFRLRQNVWKSFKKTVGLLSVYGALGLVLSLLLGWDGIQTGLGDLRVAFNTLVGTALGGSALAALPALVNALKELASGLVLARSRQLADQSSRRDFRDKIGFMKDIKDEIGEINKMLRAMRPSARVVIFIDDLDRCHPAKAVEVLEAIMLLLADDDGAPFIVFLGIDARIVVKAIEERYGKVLTGAGITGYEYLDKVVQIPFRIPPAGPDALEAYVQSLLYRSDEEISRAIARQAPQAGGAQDAGPARPKGDGAVAAAEPAAAGELRPAPRPRYDWLGLNATRELLARLAAARNRLLAGREHFEDARREVEEIKARLARIRRQRQVLLAYAFGLPLLLALGVVFDDRLSAWAGALAPGIDLVALWNSILFGGIGGTLGGVLYEMWRYDPESTPRYYASPWMGMALGGLAFAFVALAQPSLARVPYAVYTVAMLVGMQQGVSLGLSWAALERLIPARWRPSRPGRQTTPLMLTPVTSAPPPSRPPTGDATQTPAADPNVSALFREIDAVEKQLAPGGERPGSPAEPPPPAEAPIGPEEEKAFKEFALRGWLGHNPRRVKRIVNVYRIARLLAGDRLPALGRREMIKWTILSEQWPFRVAWIMQHIEDGEQRRQPLVGEVGLAQVYDWVRAQVESKDSRPFAILDADAEVFESFIDPALQSEVLKAVAGRSESGLPASAGRCQDSEKDEDDREDPDNGLSHEEDSAAQ